MRLEANDGGEVADGLTLGAPKNSSRSVSTRSKTKLPMKAVYGGSVGRGRSSRGGPLLSAVLESKY